MSRSASRTECSGLVVVLAVAWTATTARAHPHVEVADLPPLPDATEELSSSATVLAAAEASEELVVGAAKREQSLGNVASAVTVISADRIRRFGYRTVGEAIASVAGAYLVDNRLAYAIGIRGLQLPGDFNTRILVLVDGASLNEAWGASAGLGFDAIVGIDEVARIEVIRGPVSSVYGTNAFFGIINIVTRGAAESARAWGHVGLNTINGPIASAGFAVGGVDRQLRGGVQVMNRIGEDVRLPDGASTHADGDGARSVVAGLVGAYGASFGQLRVADYVRQSPFAPYEVNPAGAPYEQRNRFLLLEGGHTRELSSRGTLGVRAYANLYEFTDTAPPADPMTETTLASTGTAQVFGAELRGRYEVVRDLAGVTAGIEGSTNRTRSTAFAAETPDVLDVDVPLTFSLLGVYAEVDAQPRPWLGFVGGLRYDRNSVFEDRLSPRAALFVARPERYGLKLLYAQGFRNPSAYEAYFEDNSEFIARPDDLSAESIKSYEVVAWARPRSGLSTRVSGFYWDARDIIEALDSPVAPGLLQFQNTTRYVSAGAEAEASYRSSSGWYAFGGLAYTRVGTEVEGALIDGGVINAPALTASGGLSTPLLAGWAHVSTELLVIGERATRLDETVDPPAPSPASPAWLGWNVNVYAPRIAGFDVAVGVRNLRGKRDLIPTPGDYDRSSVEVRSVPRVPGEGRELYVKVGYAY